VRKLVQTLGLLALALGLAFAQTAGSDVNFDPTAISGKVLQYFQLIVAAGVVVLGATIGVSAAWRYAKKFLKG
jgi:ABC-type transport system involved in multi-copper enzyme maturation permease subunit